MDEKDALNEIIAVQLGDKQQSVAASEELDFTSEVKQQLSDVRQQMSDLTQQVSVLSRQLHSMLSTLMLQTEIHQEMTSRQQYSYGLSAANTQQATAAERQALLDDTCQRVQVIAAVAGIGASEPAAGGTAHDASVPHSVSTKQSARQQNVIADNLMLKRLEQLAHSEWNAIHQTYLCVT